MRRRTRPSDLDGRLSVVVPPGDYRAISRWSIYPAVSNAGRVIHACPWGIVKVTHLSWNDCWCAQQANVRTIGSMCGWMRVRCGTRFNCAASAVVWRRRRYDEAALQNTRSNQRPQQHGSEQCCFEHDGRDERFLAQFLGATASFDVIFQHAP